jgi:hypothetical protein
MGTCARDMAGIERAIEWFVSKIGNPIWIGGYGVWSNGTKWFVFRPGNLSFDIYRKKLRNLIDLGFSVPNFDQDHVRSQLVSVSPAPEQDPNRIKCENPQCGHEIRLDSDKERGKLIKAQHPLFLQ